MIIPPLWSLPPTMLGILGIVVSRLEGRYLVILAPYAFEITSGYRLDLKTYF